MLPQKIILPRENKLFNFLKIFVDSKKASRIDSNLGDIQRRTFPRARSSCRKIDPRKRGLPYAAPSDNLLSVIYHDGPWLKFFRGERVYLSPRLAEIVRVPLARWESRARKKKRAAAISRVRNGRAIKAGRDRRPRRVTSGIAARVDRERSGTLVGRQKWKWSSEFLIFQEYFRMDEILRWKYIFNYYNYHKKKTHRTIQTMFKNNPNVPLLSHLFYHLNNRELHR